MASNDFAAIGHLFVAEPIAFNAEADKLPRVQDRTKWHHAALMARARAAKAKEKGARDRVQRVALCRSIVASSRNSEMKRLCRKLDRRPHNAKKGRKFMNQLSKLAISSKRAR